MMLALVHELSDRVFDQLCKAVLFGQIVLVVTATLLIVGAIWGGRRR